MKQNAETGVTFVEFIISLTIGLYLLTFSSWLYLNLHKTLWFTEGVSDIQFNGHIGLATLIHDIRMAGFIGCSHLADIKVSGAPSLTEAQILIGWRHGSPQPGLFPSLPAAKDSDIIAIQYASARSVPIIKAQSQTIQFKKRPSFAPNTLFLISDCRHAETIQLEHVKLRHRYQNDVHFSPLHHIVYYVAKTNRFNKSHHPVYALYRRNLNASDHQPTELIEGVEKMEVRYSLTSHAHMQDEVRAEAITDWRHVKSVTLTLHMSRLNNARLHTTHRSHPTYAKTRHSPDGRLKRQWQQTIALRSRQLQANTNIH